ncbi:hypothetical protein EYZ11_000814 [Aspergillus tanneri]|uniref:Uncharacterized protein n=1 Tax=Aspergillus tanneri TaxID=1220188 RepID=A0A4S3JWB0_9EURO|nr:uncharacterized protein ATNIH1004_004901 [Aspergillus tanneri]KAA8649011.1 hypothetical protein ATNIH1004_004901 [Aspergillus tanneri]THC99764.1 hypothetical protein EYZ11_000814 [Aspergillus tanneri]
MPLKEEEVDRLLCALQREELECQRKKYRICLLEKEIIEDSEGEKSKQEEMKKDKVKDVMDRDDIIVL